MVPDPAREELAKRQANAAVALLRMGQADRVWPLLQHRPDRRLRSWLIHRVAPLRGDPEPILNRLKEETDVSIRRALILILGEFGEGELTSQQRAASIQKLADRHRNDPDPGIHSAAEWLLRRWGQEKRLRQIDEDLETGNVEDNRQWYLTGEGHTMVVIPGPVEFLMGSPGTEPERDTDEDLHRRRIGRRFAIATKEVTVQQFQRFLK